MSPSYQVCQDQSGRDEQHEKGMLMDPILGFCL